MWKCSWIKVSQTKLVRTLDRWETADGYWEVNCWHCSHSEETAVWRRVVWADCKGKSRRERWLDKQTELRRCCFTSGVYVDLTQDAQLLGRETKSIINMFSKGLTKPQNGKIKLDRQGDKFVSYGNLIWQILLFFLYMEYCQNRILYLPYCVLWFTCSDVSGSHCDPGPGHICFDHFFSVVIFIFHGQCIVLYLTEKKNVPLKHQNLIKNKHLCLCQHIGLEMTSNTVLKKELNQIIFYIRL